MLNCRTVLHSVVIQRKGFFRLDCSVNLTMYDVDIGSIEAIWSYTEWSTYLHYSPPGGTSIQQ
jgi:hypothetical protein